MTVPVNATTTGAPIAYAATGLPAGLTINPTTGVVTGTPTTEQTATVTVTATSSNIADTATFAWTVTPQPIAPLITSGPPPDSTTATPYAFTVTASGSPTPTFGITSGALPPGLTLDTTSGVISGTATATGSFAFTVTASNSAGTDGEPYTITVLAAPVIAAGTPAAGVVDTPYTHTITVDGFPDPTLTVTSGALPRGLTLDTATASTSGVPAAADRVTVARPAGLNLEALTRTISGTPTVAGTFTFTVTATNSAGTDSATYTIEIAPAPAALAAPAADDPTVGSGQLPVTGSADLVPALVLAAGATAYGAVLVVIGRRRKGRT